MIKTIQRITVSALALFVGLAIPFTIWANTWGILHWYYGDQLGTPHGPHLEDKHFYIVRVALCFAMLLSVALWQLTVSAVWRLRSARVAWFLAIVLAVMYWLLVVPTFACLCTMGMWIVRTSEMVLALLVLRCLIGFIVSEARVALLFYIPLMIGLPIVVNYTVRVLTDHG